jgi:1-acyl-sn-glycerol-3-phosphate acyltransferase
MLWVSNHVSWTDIPLLGALQPLSFLSKAEVRDWPVAGWLAHKGGTQFIRRGAGDSSQVGQQLTRHLQQGHHLLIFPEGTTTDGLALRTFHGRLLSSARQRRGAATSGHPLFARWPTVSGSALRRR